MTTQLRKIKGWAIVDNIGNYMTVESVPNFGRLWIFQTKKQAEKEIKSRFYNPSTLRGSLEKVVKVSISTPNK